APNSLSPSLSALMPARRRWPVCLTSAPCLLRVLCRLCLALSRDTTLEGPVDAGDEPITGLHRGQRESQCQTLLDGIPQGPLDFRPPAPFEILQGRVLVGGSSGRHRLPKVPDRRHSLGQWHTAQGLDRQRFAIVEGNAEVRR